MKTKTIDDIRVHAIKEYPRECCGVVIAQGRKEIYVACRNDASGTENFILNPHDYMEAEDRGKIITIVHSHADYPSTPSQADRVACEASSVPWFIISVRKDGELVTTHDFQLISPTGYKAPLVGRRFYHGVLDCYTIIRDWYERQRNIIIPDFERADQWWETEQELYIDNFEKAGFYKIPEDAKLLPGDVILMQLRSKRTNHAGIFLDTEPLKEDPHLHIVPNAMLHHVYGMLSERVVYGGYWKDITRLVVRYGKD